MDSENFRKEACEDILNEKKGAILDNDVLSLSSVESGVILNEVKDMVSKEIVFNLSSDENEHVELVSEGSLTRNNINKKKNIGIVMVSSDSEFSDNNLTDDLHINAQSDTSDGNVSDVNTGIRVKWNKVSSPTGWTKSMRSYYNKPCKRQRYFNWKQILAEIRLGPISKWQISRDDLYPIYQRRKRCLICRQTDHLSKKCPRKQGTCIMCGVPGHLFYNCPRRMCLNCGIRTDDFIDRCNRCCYEQNRKCKICKINGHEPKNCPDLWRRFHCTVANKEINSSQTTLNNNIQCCNCAKRGHMFEDCKERYWTTYSPSSYIVNSYEDNASQNKRFHIEPKSHNASSSRTNTKRINLKRSRQINEISDDDDKLSYMSKQMKYYHQNDKPKSTSFMNKFSRSLSYFGEMMKKDKQKKKRRKKKNKSNSLNIEQN